jgi:cytoskeleton protein RodZ
VNAETGPPPDTAPPGTQSAGALLKAARERQGLHIGALAAAIKVSPRKLEAREADRLGELPDTTFARALAQTICRTLKIDARPVLDRLPAAGAPPLVTQGDAINTALHAAHTRKLLAGDDASLARLATKPLLVGALLLMLASVALLLWPLISPWRGQTVPAAPTAAPPPSVPATTGGAAPSPSEVGPEAPAAPGAAASATAASVPMAETVFSAPASGADPAVSGTGSAAMLQLRVAEASWIEVRDARGTTLLSRTVSPGEQVGLNGVPPLALVVGNVAATDLVFLGRSVDLTGRSRDNIARFQLP